MFRAAKAAGVQAGQGSIGELKHSTYGGGGGTGGATDSDPNRRPGKSVFGGDGGGRGEVGQIPGGGSSPNMIQPAGDGAQGKVVLRILK